MGISTAIPTLELMKRLAYELRLFGIHSGLQSRSEECLSSGLHPLEYLRLVLEDERLSRKQKAAKSLQRRAKFRSEAELEDWDYAVERGLSKPQFRDLASLSFFQNKENLIFMGPPGTGKTHIAIELGVLAAQAGFRVYCTSLKSLAKSIRLAKAKNELDLFFKKMLSARLWLIDDWAVISLPRDIAEEIFDLLDRRKYNSAMILTSNRNIDEWAEMFPDPVLANATIDRIFDRAELFLFQGTSYRLKGKLKISEIDKVEK